MSLCVEIMGLPGAGKSTFFKAAVEQWERSGIRVFHRENEPLDRRLLSRYLEKNYPGSCDRPVRRIRKYVQHALIGRVYRSARTESAACRAFVFGHTEFVAWVLRLHVARAIPEQRKKYALGLYLDSFAHYEAARSVMEDRDVLLTDPGLIQRGIALLGYGTAEASQHDLHEYLRLAPRPDLVISVEAPRAVCLDRLKERDLPERLRGLSEAEAAVFLSTCHMYLSMAKKWLRERGIALIELEHNGPMQPALEKMQAEINRIGPRSRD
jgi:thymidylate kinase